MNVCGSAYENGCVVDGMCATAVYILSIIIVEMVGDDSLNISVDLSGDDGIKYHTLRITVRVVYRGAFATLPYYFKFKKEASTEESQ